MKIDPLQYTADYRGHIEEKYKPETTQIRELDGNNIAKRCSCDKDSNRPRNLGFRSSVIGISKNRRRERPATCVLMFS